MKCRVLAFLLFLALAAGVRADEIRLKDGSKIVGTIVGYEDGAFKVETSYGFATVRKDSIAEIVPEAPKKPVATAAPVARPAPKAAAEKTAEGNASAPPKPAATAESTARPAAAPVASVIAPAIAVAAQPAAGAAPATPNASAPVARATANSTARPGATPATKPAPAAASPAASAAPAAPVAPIEPPAPPPVVELVRGNLYLNQTYGFQMYRPPDWQLIADARKDLPNAVTALGTLDESTLLIVGRDAANRDPARDSIDARAAAMERTLRSIYENYRPLSSARTVVAGQPAIEKHFRGGADNHDWSGTSLTFAHGADLFTILAMTYADSDLIQIQENVIAKTIASLRFDAAQ